MISINGKSVKEMFTLSRISLEENNCPRLVKASSPVPRVDFGKCARAQLAQIQTTSKFSKIEMLLEYSMEPWKNARLSAFVLITSSES